MNDHVRITSRPDHQAGGNRNSLLKHNYYVLIKVIEFFVTYFSGLKKLNGGSKKSLQELAGISDIDLDLLPFKLDLEDMWQQLCLESDDDDNTERKFNHKHTACPAI